MFLKAARHAELDDMRGVSANIMCGQEGKFGTASFNVYLDIHRFNQTFVDEDEKTDDNIENIFDPL